jgi:hypothetical protein
MDEQRKNPYRRPPKPTTTAEAVRPAVDRNRPAEPNPSGGRKGIRRLPGEFQDLAEGKIDRLSRPRPAREPLEDEREGAVIAGVRNSEARAVYDARVAVLRAALAQGHQAELEEGLREVRQLALWRARSVTDYRAFAESVVGVPPVLSQTLIDQQDAAGDATPLPAQAVALLIRIEAALLQRPPGGRARLRRDEHGLQLELRMPIDDVARSVEALSDVGRAVAALRRFLRPDQAPAVVTPERTRERPERDREDPRRAQGRSQGTAGPAWRKAGASGRQTTNDRARRGPNTQAAGRDRGPRKPPWRER